MTFVGKELGVLGWQHKLKQRESMTHLVLSFYPLCIHGGNLATMTKFLPKRTVLLSEVWLYRSLHCGGIKGWKFGGDLM